MHTVDLLEQAINLAQALGYRIRQEWLGGSGGGGCEIRGQKWIFVDLAQTPVEQFAQVADALRHHPQLAAVAAAETGLVAETVRDEKTEPVALPMTTELRRAIALRKSA